MGELVKITEEHAFSIELKSKEHIRLVTISDAEEKVLIEGFLGELEELNSVEDVMVEIKGINGVLRMDLRWEELRRMLQRSCTPARRGSPEGRSLERDKEGVQ